MAECECKEGSDELVGCTCSKRFDKLQGIGGKKKNNHNPMNSVRKIVG